MVFHWSLSGSKSLHVSMTHLRILADLNDVMYDMYIQWKRWIFSKELTTESDVYICTFLKEINNDGSLHDYCARWESTCFNSINCLSAKVSRGRLIFTPFINIFFSPKYASWCKSHIFLWISYSLHFSATKIWWQISVQAESTQYD